MSSAVDDHPSLLWITIPPIALLSAYFVRRWYLARRLRLYGIGKGADGFQTNVKRVRVTPDIAARIRRGEDVSPSEIEAASRAADEQERLEALRGGSSTSTSSTSSSTPRPRGVFEERDDRHLIGKDTSPSTSPGPATRSATRAARAAVEEPESAANEWLPDSITKPTKRKKGRR